MRRALAMLLVFQHDTGQAHSHCGATTRDHVALLAAMGETLADIAATLSALRREAEFGPV